MKPEYAEYLIKKTKDYFDKNVEGFSGSRKELWPEFEELKKYIKDSEKILDLGCGNGRLFELFQDKNVKYIGVDSSEKFIQKARGKYGDHFQVTDILSLPFFNNYFDSIWSIAVFHHIPSNELHLEVLEELKRVLKKDGRIIMICWHLYQGEYLKLLLKFTLIKFFKKSRLDYKDILLSPKKMKIQRYYHAFTKKELKKLFQKAGFRVEELRYLKRNKKKTNILIIATKL